MCFLAGPCKRQSFTTKVADYGKGLYMQSFQHEEMDPELIEPIWISLHIDKTTAKIHTKALRVGLNDLVSAVGGGLGLFMGFSLFSTLKTTGTYFNRKIGKNRRKPVQEISCDL